MLKPDSRLNDLRAITDSTVSDHCAYSSFDRLHAVINSRTSVLSREQVGSFYKEHYGKFFFPRLVSYMSRCVEECVVNIAADFERPVEN
jgi:hypothetical protein